jgi:predicted transcriptional regulator
MTKEKVLETVRSLPDEFTLDELLERLFILEIIEKGMQQVREGRVVSSEEARKRFEKWLR